MKKKGECLKCGSKEQLTMHHCIPKVFKVPTNKVRLCRTCHDAVEIEIAKAEAIASNERYGKRYQLRNIDYIEILNQYLNT